MNRCAEWICFGLFVISCHVYSPVGAGLAPAQLGDREGRPYAAMPTRVRR